MKISHSVLVQVLNSQFRKTAPQLKCMQAFTLCCYLGDDKITPLYKKHLSAPSLAFCTTGFWPGFCESSVALLALVD